jgi:PST family polysaccharide transporter
MASAPVIAWFYKEPLLKPIVVAMAVPILLGGLSTQHHALLIRKMKFYGTSAYEMGVAITSLTIAIVLACWGWGYWALVAKWIISPLAFTGGAWVMCGWRPGLPARGTGVRPMLRFAFNTCGNFVMNYFGRNVDKILIGRFQGSQSLGNYDRAYHLSLVLPHQLVSPLTGVAIATFSRLSNDPEKYRHNYLTILSIFAFVGMPLSTTFTLIGKDLIILLLGPQWNTAGQIFSVFGLSIGVSMLYYTHPWLHPRKTIGDVFTI